VRRQFSLRLPEIVRCLLNSRPFFIRTFTSKFLQYYGIMADIQNK
jgi:hypothetical protein